MRCTGHCCTKFTITGDEVGYWQGTRLRDWLVACQTPTDDQRLIRQLLIPVIGSDDLFACNAHDPVTGHCRTYDDRPLMCLRYPQGFTCRGCGARSDAEARGMALQIRP